MIHRLRTNQPLTETDLEGLERTLAEIGEEEGEELLAGLLSCSESPSLAHFVRCLVGLNDRSLTPPQIRFVEMVIDQLTSRGVMDASALYELGESSASLAGVKRRYPSSGRLSRSWRSRRPRRTVCKTPLGFGKGEDR